MRDIALVVFLYGSVPFVLRRPTLGVLLWAWVSVMAPHRLTYGIAFDQPFGQVIVVATLLGMLFSKEPKRLPATPVTMVMFLLVLWINVSTVFAIDTEGSKALWEKVMKIQFMVFVTIYLLHTRRHVHLLIWVLAGSVAFYGVKGGIFTLTGGGMDRVYGPPGSYIEENNTLGLATIMTIPLLEYLRLQAANRWLRRGLLASMVVCGFSALGSQSRGALIAIGAMLVFFWAKSANKAKIGIVLVLLVPVAIAFMPETWTSRMQTIETYQEDASAMGRINAWMMAWNLAKDRPLVGGGFNIYTPGVFGRYAPNPNDIHAAHSIYFTMLGEHGFIGFALFLLLWALVWRDAYWIVRQAKMLEGLKWASDLAKMIQVSLIGYATGGAFLSLAYFDVPYDLAAALVLTRILVEKEIMEKRPSTSRHGELASAADPKTATGTPIDIPSSTRNSTGPF